MGIRFPSPLPRPGGGNETTTVYKGKVTADKITGTRTVGDNDPVDWVATRRQRCNARLNSPAQSCGAAPFLFVRPAGVGSAFFGWRAPPQLVILILILIQINGLLRPVPRPGLRLGLGLRLRLRFGLSSGLRSGEWLPKELKYPTGRKSAFGRVASPEATADGSASRPYLRLSPLCQKLICALPRRTGAIPALTGEARGVVLLPSNYSNFMKSKTLSLWTVGTAAMLAQYGRAGGGGRGPKTQHPHGGGKGGGLAAAV